MTTIDPRRIEYVPVGELRPDPRNPKAHDEATIDASIGRFGVLDLIVRDERTGYIVSGHGRQKAFTQMQARGESAPEGVQIGESGEWLVPVVVGWASRTDSEAAAALNPRGGRIILSNKHGFMFPDHHIPAPYNSHWGYPDTMSDEGLRAMISKLDLRPGDYVVNTGAQIYASETRRLFPDFVRVVWPAKHLPDRRMGQQVKLHNALIQLGRVPDRCMRDCEYRREDITPVVWKRRPPADWRP